MKTLLATAIICMASQSAQARISTYGIFTTPSAHEQYLERQRIKEVRKAHRKQRPAPYVSKWALPKDSDGLRVSNSLGTVYCGIKGCWR